VRLRSGGYTITLHYGAKDEAKTAALNPGEEHAFAGCRGVSLSSWAARCDMP
jgi:hypothetical protein